MGRGSTLSGSEAASCPRCPRFRKCGFRRTWAMKVDLRSCTECVSEFDEPQYAQSKMSHVEAEHHSFFVFVFLDPTGVIHGFYALYFVCNLYHSFLPRCDETVCAQEDHHGFDQPL